MSIRFYTVKECNRIIGIDDCGKIYIRDFENWEEIRSILVKCWKSKENAGEFCFNEFVLEYLDKETQNYILNEVEEISEDELPEPQEVVWYKNEKYIIHSGINILQGYLLKYMENLKNQNM